jgi:hypothetical protein
MPRKKASPAIDPEQLTAVAREGLAGIAAEGEVGEFLPASETDGVWTVQARSLQRGYPGWLWTVLVTPADDGRLTVTEVNLLPGDDSLLSPDWVPWSERMDDYRRQEAEREAAELLDLDADTDDDDDDDDDLDDVLDGIDIDQLDIDLDPSPLEVPDEPNDVFDHVDLDEED